MTTSRVCSNRVELRTDDDGAFDELLMYDARGNVLFHMEMMSDKSVWFALEPTRKDRFDVWISSRGKLTVVSEE